MEKTTTEYLVDEVDRIVSVSGPWDRFADENDGINARADAVCGRSIWDFIAGDGTRMWLDAIFKIARVRRASIERSYRCDSPDVKRFMRMRIIPGDGGALRIEHEVLGMEERHLPVYIRYKSSKDTGKIRLRCSICGRVRHGKVWEEPCPEHAGSSGEIVVVYSVCEACCRVIPEQIRTKPKNG